MAYPDENYRHEVAEELTNQVIKASEDSTYKIRRESIVTCKDGSLKHILWKGNMLGDQLLSCGFDMTLIKQNERELIAAKNMAEENDRLKTAFLLNISHEIRTPMNGILGFLNFLNETDLSNEDKSDYFEIINQSGKRLLNTINDIVEISKIEIGDIHLNYENFNIYEFMNHLYSNYQSQVQEKGLEFEMTNQIEILVNTDRNMLEVIFRNLLKNALKFTEKGKIVIGNYLIEDTIWFYVTDTGNGISEEKLGTIFDRFVQADIGLNRKYEGLGIGLSIVKSFVEALNGNIEVKSEIGKGSTFLFSLPLEPCID